MCVVEIWDEVKLGPRENHISKNFLINFVFFSLYFSMELFQYFPLKGNLCESLKKLKLLLLFFEISATNREREKKRFPVSHIISLLLSLISIDHFTKIYGIFSIHYLFLF